MEYLTLAEIGKILDLGVFYLGTKGTCGNPRVRPMRSNIVHNGKLYFGTTHNKSVSARQIFWLCVCVGKQGWQITLMSKKLLWQSMSV